MILLLNLISRKRKELIFTGVLNDMKISRRSWIC